MNYTALLPIPNGVKFSEWAVNWIEETAPIVQSILAAGDVDKMRDRNEQLSSYLATLSVIQGAYRVQIQSKRREFSEHNPPPSSGIKRWEAELDDYLGDLKTTSEFIESWYNAVAKRISVSQTNLRSRSAEVTSFG